MLAYRDAQKATRCHALDAMTVHAAPDPGRCPRPDHHTLTRNPLPTATFRVVLDASVLPPQTLCGVLLGLADADMFRFGEALVCQ